MKLDKLIEETRTADEINRLFNWSEDELAAMDETEFRARFRERCHHTMEIQVYENAFRGKPLSEKQVSTAEKYMRVWDRRGLSHDCHEYKFAATLLGFAKQLIAGEITYTTQYDVE